MLCVYIVVPLSCRFRCYWRRSYIRVLLTCDALVTATAAQNETVVNTPSLGVSFCLSRDRRRLEEAAEDKRSSLAESSRDADKAATTAQERISRIEAEHGLALRENGKASVRQRALERELARIKSRCRKQNPGNLAAAVE